MSWNAEVKVKHLFVDSDTENGPIDESHETVQHHMNNVADVLRASGKFINFNIAAFRTIPQGDGFFTPVDYANKLLDRMYDYADQCRIWIR